MYGAFLPEPYVSIMAFTKVVDFDWSAIVVPGACLANGFYTRLALRGGLPIGVICIVLVVGWMSGIVWNLRHPELRKEVSKEVSKASKV